MPAITIITAWDMDRRRFVFCPSDGEKLDLAGAVYIFPDGTEPGAVNRAADRYRETGELPG